MICKRDFNAEKIVLDRIARKVSLYADEMLFAFRAPRSIGDKLRLMCSTLAFHYRNWRAAPIDPGPRMRIDLDIEGYGSTITLRPRDGDIAVFHEIFVRRAYDIPSDLLPPSSVRTIVDAGSNIGITSQYLAGRYRNARVFSIEPNPDNFALLQENVTSEPRIVPIQACVTAKPNQAVFITTGGRGSHFQMNSHGDGVCVRGISLNQLCEERGIDHIDLLKVDIEGAEVELFGDGSFLPKVRIIAAEIHGDYDLERFNADLSRWGFRAWVNHNSQEQGLVLAARA